MPGYVWLDWLLIELGGLLLDAAECVHLRGRLSKGALAGAKIYDRKDG